MNTLKFIFVVSIALLSADLIANYTIKSYGQETQTPLEMVRQYCWDHVDKILAGGDPVQDLRDAGLIQFIGSENITCQNVDLKIFQAQSREKLMEDLDK